LEAEAGERAGAGGQHHDGSTGWLSIIYRGTLSRC
jgi:hypothetical protein